MTKYEPLYQRLKQRSADRVKMTFAEIEGIISAPLPKSARTYREWWNNGQDPSRQCWAWIKAGFEVIEKDLKRGIVVFRRVASIFLRN